MTPILRRVLPDGRIIELWRMIFNDRITITLPEYDGFSHEDAWCYTDRDAALIEAQAWNGDGEPAGWSKHPRTGRWRGDGTAASEINQYAPP